MGTLLHCNVQCEYVLLWSPLTQGYIDCYNLTLVGIDNTTAEAFSEKEGLHMFPRSFPGSPLICPALVSSLFANIAMVQHNVLPFPSHTGGQ